MIIGAEQNVEMDSSTIESRVKARDIVATILDFGVSQDEIKLIVSGLAMELENRELMLKLVSAINESDGF